MVRFIIQETKFSYSKRHLFDMLDLLVQKYQWKYISRETITHINFKQNPLYNQIQHLLLITGSSEIQDIILPNTCKISYIIDDLHTTGSIRQARIDNHHKVFKIFATYAYCFHKFFPMISNKMVEWLPHSARYIIPFNDNPINKILLCGRVNYEQYPNRCKMLIYSDKNKFIHYEESKLNGYRAQNKDDIDNQIYGEKFYKLLNKYLICFTCDANFSRPYIVAKHFEILASGSLLFSCNPFTKIYFERLGFIENQHYISCNNRNMQNKIQWLQDPVNLPEINKIRKNGYNKVKEHTWIQRTEFINNILN